jgi:hypothetical protein
MRANRARLRWPLRGTKHSGMVVIHTAEQLEQARLTLEQRSPQVLPAFILTLIHEPNGIGNYVLHSQGQASCSVRCIGMQAR